MRAVPDGSGLWCGAVVGRDQPPHRAWKTWGLPVRGRACGPAGPAGRGDLHAREADDYAAYRGNWIHADNRKNAGRVYEQVAQRFSLRASTENSIRGNIISVSHRRDVRHARVDFFGCR